MLFLVYKSTEFPPDMPNEQRNDLMAREKQYGLDWAAAGKSPHLWRVVGPRLANVAIYDVESLEELNDFLMGLPMRAWMDVTITPLALHPSRKQ